MVIRSDERDPDLCVHGDDDFAVGTRTELFAFSEHLDDKYRINLIGMICLVCEEHSMEILKTVVGFNHELCY